MGIYSIHYIRKQKNKNKTEDNKQVDTKYLLACGRNLINLVAQMPAHFAVLRNNILTQFFRELYTC